MTTTPSQVPATTTPAAAPAAQPYTVRNLLMDKQAEILAALPRHITPAYFLRVVLTAVQRNPDLAKCTSLSFLGAVLQCAQLGLVPDGFLGQAYLIPYANRRKNVLECQFQAGYRGLIVLARRSGEISNVGAKVAHARDKFVYTDGLSPTVEHKAFDGDEDPGDLTHAYAWYRLKDGGFDIHVMNRRQVHKIRERSQAYKQGVSSGRRDSPWFTDEEWMWKKTALKQLLKLAPLSVEIQRATGLDDAHEHGLPQDLALLADPNAEATPLLDGDVSDDATDPDVIQMPQRLREKVEPPAEPAPVPARAGSAPPKNGAIVDRIVQVSASGDGVVAVTEGQMKLWTRDRELGNALIAARDQLRQITADPADAQGRRRLTGLAQ